MSIKLASSRRNRTSLFAGLILGSSLAVAGLAVASTGPQESFTDPLADSGSGNATLREPMRDKGSHLEIVSVKKATSDLLTDRVAPQRFPRNKGLAKSFASGVRAQMIRSKSVAETWANRKARAKSIELQSAITKFAEDPSYLPFYDNRFIVSLWQGVSIHENQAFVLLIGHQEYENEDGSWQADSDDQWQISLRHENGVWKLFEVEAVAIGGGR